MDDHLDPAVGHRRDAGRDVKNRITEAGQTGRLAGGHLEPHLDPATRSLGLPP